MGKRGFYLGLRVQGWLNSSHTQKGWLMMIMWEIFFLSYCTLCNGLFYLLCNFLYHINIFFRLWSWEKQKTLREFQFKGSKTKEKLSHHLYRLQRVKFTLTRLDTTTPIHPTPSCFSWWWRIIEYLSSWGKLKIFLVIKSEIAELLKWC